MGMEDSQIEFPRLTGAAEDLDQLQLWGLASVQQAAAELGSAVERPSISEATENISLSTWAAKGACRGAHEPVCSLQQWVACERDGPCTRFSSHLLELDDEVADTATSSSSAEDSADSGSYDTSQRQASGEEGSLDSRRDFPSSSDAFSFGFVVSSKAASGLPSWPFCKASASGAAAATAEVLVS